MYENELVLNEPCNIRTGVPSYTIKPGDSGADGWVPVDNESLVMPTIDFDELSPIGRKRIPQKIETRSMNVFTGGDQGMVRNGQQDNEPLVVPKLFDK